MAQRRGVEAGGERLGDVDYVQRVGQQPLDRVAGGDRQHLMAPSFELLREPPDELVDPVAGAPPVGRDLGYRKAPAGTTRCSPRPLTSPTPSHAQAWRWTP